MKLNSFQIKNYKVIDDTGPVKVDPKLTALVGQERERQDRDPEGPVEEPKRRRTPSSTSSTIFLETDIPRSDQAPRSSRFWNSHFPNRRPRRSQNCFRAVQASRPTKITRITRYEGQNGIGSEIIFESSAAETLTGRDAAAAIEAASRDCWSQPRLRRCRRNPTSRLLRGPRDRSRHCPVWTEQNVAALESYPAVVTNWVNADQSGQSRRPLRRPRGPPSNPARRGEAG